MRDRINATARRVPTAFLYIGGAILALWLLFAAVQDSLGPDPVKALEQGLGIWALRFLLASLCITPLMRAGIRLLKFRRALGLLGFAYAALHFATWIALDMGLRWGQIAGDLTKRPYIIVGALGLLLLLPLAATSWNGAIRRLGAAAWNRLHRLAYPAILAGAVHFVMIGKVWTGESLVYLGIAMVLLVLRVPQSRRIPARAT
ncbi:protein-methionine-sulfoxide reductase heme-binding subunit MsrQ [Tabrizicola oligotrophica]|uniref:Protein-methionine-sulfoxide reductase heme-binding subunit MsrQ n=1 Tax=Tabrizicola oligotrophica TaxID=2710650 RepID=A0A6M0QXL3_9RHOB|nr:protein-methionine-sulfoxide reductase heme-binding subunit MsrQ [Tabrizicola oligotrophica]NEY91691.1 protein-methionine-sulfoxide reductase heme-binding subunit MsrQ [Tabrizicola oligotrophica]